MKPTFNRLSFLSQIVLAITAAASVQAGTWTWNATTGNWSDDTKWEEASVPDNDGTADLTFKDSTTVYTATANPAALTPASNEWQVNSLTFSNSGAGTVNNTVAGATNAKLLLGAGGIVQNENASPVLSIPIVATASQDWSINEWRTNNTAGLHINGDLTLNNGVTITKTGANAGKGDLYFNSGTTTTLGTGAFTLSSMGIWFNNVSQVGRLGTNPLIVDNSSISRRTNLRFNYNDNSTFANDVQFEGWTSAADPGLVLSYSTSTLTAAGTTLTLSGNLSGEIPGGTVNGNKLITIDPFVGSTWDRRYQLVLNGDNGSLTTPNTALDRGAVHVRKGFLVAASPNALGSTNDLDLLVGHNASTVSNALSGILATSGNHISAPIFLTRGVNGTIANNRNAVAELGLSGTGAATFSGIIALHNGGASVANTVATLKLTAPAGGQADFTGVIRDQFPSGSDPSLVPVQVSGGGAVKLSGNNTYRGTTAVRGGTLLLGHNGAMGLATTSVSLGDTVVAPSGGNVVAATTVELPGAAWTSGVFTFSGGGIATLDGVTLADGDRILVKDQISNPERNGVYIRTSATVWDRATDLDSDAELVSGLRVHVAGGTINGNKNFCLTNGLRSGSVINTTGATGAAFFFNDDTPSNTDVAILTDAAVTISRNFTVTNNLSSGKSILGGNSAHASTFSGNVTLAKNLNVTAAAGGSVTFSGDISGGFGVTKEGAGKLVYSTMKSYTGPTSVTAGTLEVNDFFDSSAITVAGGATLQGIGVLGAVSAAGTIAPGDGSGPGTLTTTSTSLTGTLAIEINGSSSDKLVSDDALNLTGATLTVALSGSGFTEPSYVIAEGAPLTGTFASVPSGYIVTYTGTTATLTQGSSASDYDTWKSGFTFANPPVDSLPTADPDGDGLTNQQEYAFGLNPTSGSSVNPIIVPLNKTTGTFTYTRRKLSLVAPMAYTVRTSTDLAVWSPASISGQSITTVGDIETVVVTLSGAPLAAPKLFVRVSAE